MAAFLVSCPAASLRHVSLPGKGLNASTSFTRRTAMPRVHMGARAMASKKEDGPCDSQPSLGASIATAAATALCGACVALSLATSAPAMAASTSNVRLPPLSNDPNRCERAYVGNTIGQANGVADKVLDLRNCDYSGERELLKGKTLSSALMSGAKFDGADLTETVMSKAYAVGASFRGADFANSVLDRVVFDGADLTGASFYNAVLSGSTFDGADLADASFEDTLIGYVDVQKLCRNKTLAPDTKLELGCR